MIKYAALALPILMTGCGYPTPEQLAHEECLTWGVAPGTAEYVSCRKHLTWRDQTTNIMLMESFSKMGAGVGAAW